MNTDLERLFQKVMDAMGWDSKKTELWFRTNNPLLGNCSPNSLIVRGRQEWLERFIDSRIDENKPQANTEVVK